VAAAAVEVGFCYHLCTPPTMIPQAGLPWLLQVGKAGTEAACDGRDCLAGEYFGRRLEEEEEFEKPLGGSGPHRQQLSVL